MTATAPVLYGTPETAAAVASAPAVTILIGSYDGSGNYGDIAQLDAALGLLERLDPGLLLLPVLERCHLAGHRKLSEDFLHPPARALFFDPGEGMDDELLPVPAPADLAFGTCYLYGGGYLNAAWGERKLAMLRAAEALLDGGGADRVCRLSSGLQVEADWLANLDSSDAEALRAFELLGARDRGSADAFAALGSAAPVLDTSDDAVGVLRQLAHADAAPSADGRLHVNLHIAEHDWMTGRPEAMLDFHADFVAELGGRAGLPVVAQPLIAYLDARISELPTVERFGRACAARGIELAEPKVLRPAGIGEILPELRRAVVTLSCSYHVALTSLLLEVPAVLLRDNAYYEQKAAGLAESFGLPPAFALSSAADPLAAAGEIATIVLDEQGCAALRRRLGAGASRVRERRAAAEVELVARLGSEATTALAIRIREQGERLRERSAEPARLLAQLAALPSENGFEPASAPVEAATGDSAAERLAAVLSSRSWRMTAPLRRVGARLSRRRS